MGREVRCALCGGIIGNYDPSLHHLELDGDRAAEICGSCIDSFLKWQQRRYATLFPTRAAKKRFGKK